MNKTLTKIFISVVMAFGITGTVMMSASVYESSQEVIVLKKKCDETQLKIDDLNKKLKSKQEQLKNKDIELNKIKRVKESLELENKKLKESPTKLTQRKGEPIRMTLTYYGDFGYENGGYAGIDARGEVLRDGTVASNVYDFGTKFELNGKIYTVNDRGGIHFDSYNRLDVFVARQAGESDSEYEQRISDLGKITVTMYKR